MDDRNRQLGASTTAPTLAPPCTECRGFQVSALVRGNWRRGTCPACGGAGTAEAQQARSAAEVATVTAADRGRHACDCEGSRECAECHGEGKCMVPRLYPRGYTEVYVDCEACGASGECPQCVTAAAPPQPEPAEAAGEVLPLWVQRYGAFWSRGDYAARVEVFARGDAFRGRGSAPDGSELRCGDYTSVEAAMSAIDEAANRAGHRLPADSMVFRPELADEVRGTVWQWRTGEGTYLVDAKVSWSLDATREVIRALKQVISREQTADALARILRVHGADVREVRS